MLDSALINTQKAVFQARQVTSSKKGVAGAFVTLVVKDTFKAIGEISKEGHMDVPHSRGQPIQSKKGEKELRGSLV